MGFNLDQFLSNKELSVAELDEFSVSLELDLTEIKRNYAYAIANLKRIEIQIKEAAKGEDQKQHIVGLQQKYASFASSANAIKKQISVIETNLMKVGKKKASIQRKVKKVIDEKGLNKTLGLINSSLLINVIEYPVIQEARSQIHNLSQEAKQKITLVEVVAYALNRLPSMYASTKDGYRHHHNTATGEFYPKIIETVRRAIRVLLVGDPLHDSSDIPDEVFCDPPGLLSRLCQLFDRKQMRWKEVPSVLHSLMPDYSNVDLQGEPLPEPKNSFLSRKDKVSDITSYLKRSKLRSVASNSNNNSDDDFSSNLSWKSEAKEAERAEMQQQIFQIYTLKGKLKYINVTEKFIMVATLHLMAGITSDEVDLVEVAAHALNYFPQTYVTTERGLTLLRQKSYAKLPEYIEQVRKSFARVKYSTRLLSEPLYFAEFNLEYQEAMTALATMLDRDDLSPDNLIDVIKTFIE
jgi:hypothetical protein